MNMRFISIVVSVLLFSATVYFVHLHVGWARIFLGVTSLPLALLCICIGLMFTSYFLRAWRIRVGLRLSNQLLDILQLSVTHTLINNLMPMRLGEAAFPLLMKQKFNVGFGQSTSHLLLFRLLDLAALISVGVLVVAFSLGIALGFASLVLLYVCFLVSNPIKNVLVSKLTSSKYKRLDVFCDNIHALPTKGWLYSYIIMITFGIWLTKLSAFAAITVYLANISVSSAIVAIVAADLSSVLPVHGVAGTGTFEGAFVLGGQVSQVKHELLLSAAIQLHLFLLFTSVLAYSSVNLIAIIKHWIVGRLKVNNTDI